MSFNLIKTIQEKLGYSQLQKIDPNTQEIKTDVASPSARLGQAAIPAVLIGFYKYIKTDEGLRIFNTGVSNGWFERIFDGTASAVISKIAAYSEFPQVEVDQRVHGIADEAVKTVKEQISNNKSANLLNVRDYMSSQRADILSHLPAALQTGEILNDDTIDDRTNKMHGPVSNFMHGIENIFSGPGNKNAEPDNAA